MKLSKPSEAVWSHLLIDLALGSWLAFGQNAMELDVARACKISSSSIVNDAFGISVFLVCLCLSVVTGKTVALPSCLHSTKQNLDFYHLSTFILSVCALHVFVSSTSTVSRLALRMVLRHWLFLQHLQAIAHWWMLGIVSQLWEKSDATLKGTKTFNLKKHKL